MSLLEDKMETSLDRLRVATDQSTSAMVGKVNATMKLIMADFAKMIDARFQEIEKAVKER